ncbi:MAG: DUF4112 domain-containing protein [Pseudomonadota bacterium]
MTGQLTQPQAPEIGVTEFARLRARVHRIAWLLDHSIGIPGTRWRIGLDGLIGMVPGYGDVAAGLISAYLIYLSHRLGAPFRLKLKMLWTVLLDVVLGSIPIAGDLFDFAHKANGRIARMLDEHLASAVSAGESNRPSSRS